ncbi:hypothetical protein BFJ63_vAg10825 [Fusarium oxysporum f. sp. narcissi]|uniref:Uncharacterized protein n=1 Tax=Fusarium oxysporum f. sp. narcissi TaxID=451672 RepID=A0A4Q2VGC3_FUSOX|nr:hypothetical protein BFJ63_vAg10825 [Fusarium oxysporum f. sp. narcissi]
MAEVVVGLVSAGVGVAAFALQISSGIRALRQLQLKPEEAHKEVTVLLERFTILYQVVSSLKAWERYQPIDDVISHVKRRYEDIEPILRDLSEKYQVQGERHRRHWKRVRSMLSEHPKQQMRDIRENINDIIFILNLALMAAQCQTPNIHHPNSLPKEYSSSSPAEEEDPRRGGRERVTDVSKIGSNAAIDRRSEPQQGDRIMPSLANTCSRACGVRKYDCSCHQTGISRRFLFLQYTPLSSFVGKLSGRASGCSCIGLRLRVALSMYGVPKAIVAGIGFMVDETGSQLLSTLRTEPIVSYTSPGFETIWRLQKSLISLEEARGRLIELRRSDESFRNHKDPAGNTYIHTLLRVPWSWQQDDQFGLLHTLVTECGMTLTNETQSFLVKCAEWIGEGRHLALLEAILSYGFDATAIHASAFEEWPAPCSTDWYGGGRTPDPFFVEYIGTILKYSPSYSGSTSLHNVLLNGSLDSAADWLDRSQPLERNFNFLGQTPLHIATTCPKLCQLVLEAGHDINVRDKYGTTPLMYAAAMGQTEVTKLLISRGANPALRDSRHNWMFLDYAFFCDQSHLAMEALLVLQTKFNSRVFQLYVRCAIMSTLGHQNALTEDVTFLPKFIELCDDVNFTFEDRGIKDNNLMHYARTLETASTLVQCGFNSFNQKNSEGKLAINSLSNCCNVPLIRFCLVNGTDISNMSRNGRSIFFELVPRLSSFDWLTWDSIDGIKLCLSAGADPFAADNCICPCSPDGCHIASKLGLEFSSFSFLSEIPDPVWVLEFISLVEDYRGLRAAEKLLLSLHRRIRCDQTDISITHVCCHRGRAIGRIGFQDRSLHSEDIEDILDEENAFIDVLDTEMRELASFTFSKLLTEFITHLKIKYNIRLEDTRRKREKVSVESKSKGQTYEVDYRADRYKENFSISPTDFSESVVARSMAQYAFWLQHECSRTDKPLARNFNQADWLKKRISWFLELMKAMNVPAEMLEKEMRSISIKETRTEVINCEETVNGFLEMLEKASLSRIS